MYSLYIFFAVCFFGIMLVLHLLDVVFFTNKKLQEKKCAEKNAQNEQNRGDSKSRSTEGSGCWFIWVARIVTSKWAIG